MDGWMGHEESVGRCGRERRGELGYLLSGGDVEKTEISLQLGDVALKVLEGGSDLGLELVGLPAPRLNDLDGHLL